MVHDERELKRDTKQPIYSSLYIDTLYKKEDLST